MTIPFEAGIFAKAPNRFELPLEPAKPRPSGRGFRRLVRYRAISYLVVCVGLWRAGAVSLACPFTRSAEVLAVGGYPPGASCRRISAMWRACRIAASIHRGHAATLL